VLLARDRDASRWRNGGGITWEVAAGSTSERGDFDWRISIAEVSQFGPFSGYPGIDRIITVIEGAGLDLTVDGSRYVLGPYEPFRFRGEATTAGSPVGGVTKDLNVMVRRDCLTAELDLVELVPGQRLELPEPVGTTVVVVLDGQVRAAAGGKHLELLAPDGLLAGGRPVVLVGDGPACVAVIELRAL
jgi:hypothetical protein